MLGWSSMQEPKNNNREYVGIPATTHTGNHHYQTITSCWLLLLAPAAKPGPQRHPLTKYDTTTMRQAAAKNDQDQYDWFQWLVGLRKSQDRNTWRRRRSSSAPQTTCLPDYDCTYIHSIYTYIHTCSLVCGRHATIDCCFGGGTTILHTISECPSACSSLVLMAGG